MTEVAAPPQDLERQLEQHRRELVAYCYRMLGSAFEAEDAVQETMVRAWRGFDRFEGRSSLRSWLYRIATNVCLDMLGRPQRRARPMDLGAGRRTGEAPLGAAAARGAWVQPIPDGRVLAADGDPAELAVAARVDPAGVRRRPAAPAARQRAVLILREVLRWQAERGGRAARTRRVASVNSALQRARATLAERGVDDGGRRRAARTTSQRELLARYVDAFERYDIDALIALLHEDATLSMPPYELWLQGPDDIRRWLLGHGTGCRGSRLRADGANGSPAFGQYRPTRTAAGTTPWALQVLEVARRPDRRDQLLPRHPGAVPAVRAPRSRSSRRSAPDGGAR